MLPRRSVRALAGLLSFTVGCAVAHSPVDGGSDTGVDGGPCGTLGLDCASDDDCLGDTTCLLVPDGFDAGPGAPRGVCKGPGLFGSGGTCGGWSGAPCANPAHACVDVVGVEDIELCFDPLELECLCRSALLRGVITACAE